ncbi:hypothetical protein N431DRAFT_551950 [Stipitochalara longipes BDJ]|nr:hypothetical protein N431DRAFT_551950 [Stipitochalara longipes BDJ]
MGTSHSYELSRTKLLLNSIYGLYGGCLYKDDFVPLFSVPAISSSFYALHPSPRLVHGTFFKVIYVRRALHFKVFSPKAPKPRHHKTHTILRMSTPEIIKQTARRLHKSSTTKHRSASVDTACGVDDFRHCYRTRAITPMPPAGSPRPEHQIRPSKAGKEKRERALLAKKVSKTSRHKNNGASTSKKAIHRKSRHYISSRPCSQVRNSSTRPPSSRRPHSKLASYSPSCYSTSLRPMPSPSRYMQSRGRGYYRASSHDFAYAGTRRSEVNGSRPSAKSTHQGRKTRHQAPTTRKNRFTRQSSSQIHSTSPYYRSPAPSNPRASPIGSSRTYLRRPSRPTSFYSPISAPATLYGSAVNSPELRTGQNSPTPEFGTARNSPALYTGTHSPVANGSLPYRTAVSPLEFCQRSPSASSPASHAGSARSWHSEASYASIPWSALEKHAHCRQPDSSLRARGSLVSFSADGKPLRPQHEEAPEYFVNPIVSIAQDGNISLHDPLRGLWYHFSTADSKDRTTGLKFEDSGEFEPTELPEDDGLGFHCPCYDEVHGHEASARVIHSLRELERQEYVVDTFSQAILDAFPWMGKEAAEQRARDDVYWLGDQYVRKYDLKNEFGQDWVQESFIGARLLGSSGLLEEID